MRRALTLPMLYETLPENVTLVSIPSDNTLSDILFSGKVISVSEFQSTSPLKRILTPKKNECGLKTRKTIVTLYVYSDCIKEVLEDQVIASIDLNSIQFCISPTKQKRFQFTLLGLDNGQKVRREYEVQSASELAVWYSQLNPTPTVPSGQTEMFWTEFAQLVRMVKDSVKQSMYALEESNSRLDAFLQSLNSLE